MSAKEMVLEHAPAWTEEQARRALLAAEGHRSVELEGRSERRALMERAASLRARQPEVVDAVALAREARDELEQRSS